MTSYWFQRAMVGETLRAGVHVEVVGGRILRLTVDTPPAPEDTALQGLALPGLASAHSHAFHRILRGRTHADGGTFWTWRQLMYRAAAALTPENYYDLARGVFAEMLLAGYTAVGEFHYVHHRPDGTPYAPATAMADALGAAAADVGIRLTLLDTLYRFGGVGESGELLPLGVEQQRFGDATVEDFLIRHRDLTDTWAEADAATRRIGLAAHSLRAVDPADAKRLQDAFPDQVLHAHVSEQPAENTAVQTRTGTTPVRSLAGVVGPRFTGVHLTHLTADDITDLADAGAIACFCPTTERDLADGIGPAGLLRDAGVRIALGSDQNAVIDPFEEMRALEMDERLLTGRRGSFSPVELLRAASRTGYQSLGWDDGGSLEVGALCDVVVIDDRSRRTAGADRPQLWLAATGADVTDVIVHGRQVVRAGEHALGDVGAFLDTAIAGIEGRITP